MNLAILQVKAFAKALAKGGAVKLNEPRKVVHPETFYVGKKTLKSSSIVGTFR